jgi:hypothetical protein
MSSMAVSRAYRQREREGRVVAVFGKYGAARALDPEWHDCYGDVTPPQKIIDDALLSQAMAASRVSSSPHDWR